MAKETSLKRQLEKLRTPQTSAFESRRGRASFLYEYHEAATIDCDTHFSLAVEGFEGLVTLDPSLKQFSATLFDVATKDWSRAINTPDVCQKMDEEVEQFIWRGVAPFLNHFDCQKVLEWLIYKFRVHEYAVDLLIVALSPYHETALFPKLLQCFESFKSKSHKWHFLYPNQKTGSPLPKSALIAHAKTRSWFMSEMTLAATKSQCQPVLAHVTSVWIGVLADGPEDGMIQHGLEFCENGFKSTVGHVLPSIALFALMVTKFTLTPQMISLFLKKSSKKMSKTQIFEPFLQTYMSMLVLVSRHQELESVPKSTSKLILSNLKLLEGVEANSLFGAVISSLKSDSPTYLDDLETCFSKMTKVPKKCQSIIQEVVIQNAAATNDQKAAIVTLLLKLVKSNPKMSSFLDTILADGSCFPEIVEKLTVVDGQRIPYDRTCDSWSSVLLLLEHFNRGQKFTGSTLVMEQCFALLKESFLVTCVSDYYRKSLVSTISSCMNQEDIDKDKFDTGCLLESLSFLRHGESHKACLDLMSNVITSQKNNDEVARNLAVNFAYIGNSLVLCDDQFTLDLVNQTIDRLIPLLATNPSSIESLLQILIDSLADIPNHRRVDIFCRTLGLINDDKWTLFVVLRLVTAAKAAERRDVALKFAIDLFPHLPQGHQVKVIEMMAKLTSQSVSTINPVTIMERHKWTLAVNASFFLSSMSPESVSETIPSFLKNVFRLLIECPSHLVDDKDISPSLLSMLEKFLDMMTMSDFLTSCEWLFNSSNSKLMKLTVIAANKKMRHHAMNKEEVEKAVKLATCATEAMFAMDPISEDSLPILTCIKLVCEASSVAKVKPAPLCKLTDRLLKLLQQSSASNSKDCIKIAIGSSYAACELVILFEDKEQVEQFVGILEDNLSSPSHLIALSSVRCIRKMVTDHLSLIDHMRGNLLHKVESCSVDGFLSNTVSSQILKDKNEIVNLLTASISAAGDASCVQDV